MAGGFEFRDKDQGKTLKDLLDELAFFFRRAGRREREHLSRAQQQALERLIASEKEAEVGLEERSIPWADVKEKNPGLPDEFWGWLEENVPEGYEIPFTERTIVGGVTPADKARSLQSNELKRYLDKNLNIFTQQVAPAAAPKGFPEYNPDDIFRQEFIEDLRKRQGMIEDNRGATLSAEQIEDASAFVDDMIKTRDDTSPDIGLWEYWETSAGEMVDFDQGSLTDILTLDQVTKYLEAQGISAEEAALREASIGAIKGAVGDVPAGMRQDTIIGLANMVEVKRTDIAKETGRLPEDITDEEIISGMDESEIKGMVEQTFYQYSAGGGVPSLGPEAIGAIHNVAQKLGLSDLEYVQTAFEEYKQGFHPEYMEKTSEGLLWSDFLSKPEALMSKVRTDTDNPLLGKQVPGSAFRETAPGGERPRLTMAQGEPAVRVQTGKAPGEFEVRRLGAPSRSYITQQEAYRGFSSTIGRLGVGKRQKDYLLGFFPTYFKEGSKKTMGDWTKFLAQEDFKALLPGAPTKKTRFV